MYIRITDKCNMRCPHCCFACTDQGTFMTLDTFKTALSIAKKRCINIVIGGGEPTLHPHFEQFLILAIASAPMADMKVFIVTNGSIKERAELILQLSVRGIIDGRLSYDQYHDLDMIDDVVLELFRKNKLFWGGLYQSHPYCDPNFLSKTGRARKIKESSEHKCCCEDLRINPNGDYFPCGCDEAPKLGNINKGFKPTKYSGICFREIERLTNEESTSYYENWDKKNIPPPKGYKSWMDYHERHFVKEIK